MRMRGSYLVIACLLLLSTFCFAQDECSVIKVPTITELTVSRNEVSNVMEATATLSYEDKANATIRPLPAQDIWFRMCPGGGIVIESAPCPDGQHKCLPTEWNCTGGCCFDDPSIQVVKTNLEGKATALYPLVDAGIVAEYKGGDVYPPSNSTSSYTKSALGFLNIMTCMPFFIISGLVLVLLAVWFIRKLRR